MQSLIMIKDDKRRNKEMSMTCERQKELLDSIIDHISAANDTQETLHKLLFLGFTAEELHNDFEFGIDDIKDAEESMDEYED